LKNGVIIIQVKTQLETDTGNVFICMFEDNNSMDDTRFEDKLGQVVILVDYSLL